MNHGAGGLSAGLISSWPRDIARGSGTARFLIEWTGALSRAGVDLAPIAIDLDPDDPDFVRRRFEWNASLVGDPRLRGLDVLLAIDYDGFALPEGGAPRIVCPQGIFAELAETEPEPSRSALLSQAVAEGRNVQAATVVIAPSAFAAAAIVRHYHVNPQKVLAIPHGFDLDAWNALLLAAPPRTDHRPTILAVAKLYPRKGIDTLLRAVARVRSSVRGLQARIVGGGVDAPRLRSLARELDLGDAVAFFGDVADRAAIARHFREADLFCLPSRHETFGFVFLEAMAAGLPVVAADAAAAPEVLRDVGLLVPPDDPETLASAIEGLFADPQARARRGALGVARAAGFSWKTTADRYRAVMMEVRR